VCFEAFHRNTANKECRWRKCPACFLVPDAAAAAWKRNQEQERLEREQEEVTEKARRAACDRWCFEVCASIFIAQMWLVWLYKHGV